MDVNKRKIIVVANKERNNATNPVHSTLPCYVLHRALYSTVVVPWCARTISPHRTPKAMSKPSHSAYHVHILTTPHKKKKSPRTCARCPPPLSARACFVTLFFARKTPTYTQQTNPSWQRNELAEEHSYYYDRTARSCDAQNSHVVK